MTGRRWVRSGRSLRWTRNTVSAPTPRSVDAGERQRCYRQRQRPWRVSRLEQCRLDGNLGVRHIDGTFAPALGFVTQSGIDHVYGEFGYWWRTVAGGDVIQQIDWDFKRGVDDR